MTSDDFTEDLTNPTGTYDLPGPEEFFPASLPPTWCGITVAYLPERSPIITNYREFAITATGVRDTEASAWSDVSDEIIEVHGRLDHITYFLQSTYRQLVASGLRGQSLWQRLGRYMVRMVQYAFPRIESDEPPCRLLLAQLRAPGEASETAAVLCPAYSAVHLLVGVFGQVSPLRWLSRRFVPSTTNVPMQNLGMTLTIPPSVFVPDPRIVDLFWGAYSAKGSPIQSDFKDAHVLEPCCGSGVLGILACQCGATRVFSSDIHEASVECARRNVLAAGYADRIATIRANGLRHGHAGSCVLVNPPWYDWKRRLGPWASRDEIRCLQDVGHGFLQRLLAEAEKKLGPEHSFYLFQGVDDLVRDDDQLNGVLRRWTVTHTWVGDRNLRLYRLRKYYPESESGRRKKIEG